MVKKDGATRQLSPDTVVAVGNTRLNFGQATNEGLVRTENEDALACFLSTSSSVDELADFGIFVIADGMGGHQQGEKASAMTTRIIMNDLMDKVYLPILAGQGISELPPIAEVLVSTIEKANAQVYQELGGRGGTTCTAAVVLGERVYIGHVGDSRAYLINKGKMEQLTRDHSMTQRLMEVGQLTPEEVPAHVHRNKLYRTLGFKDTLEVDLVSKRLPARCKLLLCSDGLWNMVRDSEILEFVQTYSGLQDVCDRLVAKANAQGGDDNISVILLSTG